MTFEERLIIGIEYSRYVKRNNLAIPHLLKDRRRMFIRWYMERFSSKSVDQILNELANEILYIREVTLDSIMFNEK